MVNSWTKNKRSKTLLKKFTKKSSERTADLCLFVCFVPVWAPTEHLHIYLVNWEWRRSANSRGTNYLLNCCLKNKKKKAVNKPNRRSLLAAGSKMGWFKQAMTKRQLTSKLSEANTQLEFLSLQSSFIYLDCFARCRDVRSHLKQKHSLYLTAKCHFSWHRSQR